MEPKSIREIQEAWDAADVGVKWRLQMQFSIAFQLKTEDQLRIPFDMLRDDIRTSIVYAINVEQVPDEGIREFVWSELTGGLE